MLVWSKRRREWEAFLQAAVRSMPPGMTVERVFVPSRVAAALARQVRRARHRVRAEHLRAAALDAVLVARLVALAPGELAAMLRARV